MRCGAAVHAFTSYYTPRSTGRQEKCEDFVKNIGKEWNTPWNTWDGELRENVQERAVNLRQKDSKKNWDPVL